MSLQTNQRGSAHAIIIVLLILALIGTLGVLFYQNFILKTLETADKSQEILNGTNKLKTVRAAFQSNIYAFDYPENWQVSSEAVAGEPSTTIVQNREKSVRVQIAISSSSIGGACDTTSPRKVRYYKVGTQAVTRLSDSKAYIVEAMTDAEGGGYDYKIGLTEDGGDTHAAVGDSFCTVAHVGVASRLLVNNETNAIIHPTITAAIDFPKLAAGTDLRVREMQQVKDMLATDDYKKAVAILESSRKE